MNVESTPGRTAGLLRLRCCPVFLLLALPSLAAAADGIPRLLLPHKAAKSQLLWRNGEVIDGELAGADANEVLWKSALFSDPLKVGRDFIRQMDFKEGSMDQKGGFRVALTDGSHFTGDLLRLNGESMVLKSERFGEMTLKRDTVVLLERLNQSGLVAAGPLALLKGGAELTQSNPQSAGPLRFAAAGYTASHAFNQVSCVKVDLPEKVIVDLRFRTDGPPGFNLQAGMTKESVFVETWGDELVLVMGDRFASAGAKLDEKAREAHLRLAWDRKEGRCALYGSDGKLWAEILPEPKTPEPEKKEEKPKGTWLNRLFGGPELLPQAQLIDPFGNSISNNITAVQNGVTLINKGQGILIERFAVSEWNGQPPPAVITAAACVETGTEILEGEAEALDGENLKVKLKDGTSKEVPLAALRALRWPREAKMERDAAQTDVWYDDGSLVRGKLGEIKDGKAQMETAFSAAPVLASIAGTRAIILPDPPKDTKEPDKKDAVKPDTRADQLDVLTLGKTTLRGRIVTNGGKVPQFLVFGSTTPATPSDAGDMTLARALLPDAKYERAPALLHLAGQQSVPVSLVGMDRKQVAFTWTGAEKQELDAALVHAIQFMPAPVVDDGGFASPAWQVVGKQEGKQPVRRPNGDILLSPGTGIGHPWVIQGGDIHFKVARDRGGMGTLRVRLFCNGVQRDAGSLNFIVADWGSELYCGMEREEGQLNSNIEVPARDTGNEVRISFQGSYVEFYVNDVRVVRTTITTTKRKRAGSGIILETASLWGNTEGSVKVSAFATKASALMASPPGFLESAKKEALLIPRLRRDSPPRHMLIGTNGDLLRGEIEGVTSTHFAFRTGIESFNVPRERVTAVVALTKPDKIDPSAPRADAQKKEEPKAEGGGGRLWGALFGGAGRAQVRVAGAGRVVIRNGVVIEGEEEAPPAKPEPLDKDVPNDGEQWLDLTNGGRIALKVDKWDPETVTGTHALLGKVTIPVTQVYRVAMKPPTASGAWSALSKWKLENTPDPVIPTDDKTGGADGGSGSGEPAPDFKLTTLDGKDVTLKDAKGKVIVLDFWATWCGPCVKSLPGLIEAMSAFPDDKVIFLAVNQGETKDQVQKFLDARGFKMIVGMDADQSVGKKFKVEGIPHTVIIDTEGKIALTKTGYTADGDKEIAEAVKKALAAPGVSAQPDKPAESETPAAPQPAGPVGDDFLPPPVLK